MRKNIFFSNVFVDRFFKSLLNVRALPFGNFLPKRVFFHENFYEMNFDKVHSNSSNF
jgi:hypothetical protein